MSQYQNINSILIVDDSADLRSLILLLLGKIGLSAQEAENGQLAVGMLRRQPFDLIITDFRMPVLDGVQLLAWCRSNNIHIPVIFMSSDLHLVEPEQIALADCCATMLYKPFDDQIFYAAINAADARSHHQDCIHVSQNPYN